MAKYKLNHSEFLEHWQDHFDFIEDSIELFDKGNEKEAKRSAEKQAIEDARYVFPNACETKMVFTMNVRSLYNFLNHRCCERAQWEIRELAIEMLRQLKQVAPILFRNMGPNCVQGPCPEGNMTCGKIVEIREKFKNLQAVESLATIEGRNPVIEAIKNDKRAYDFIVPELRQDEEIQAIINPPA